MKLFFSDIVRDMNFEDLDYKWSNLDLKTFSQDKIVFEYQKKAIENAIKGLYKYYNDCSGNKNKMYDIYFKNGLIEKDEKEISISLKKNKNAKIFEQFDDYAIGKDRIGFENFTNRMSFWMATGSGKTIVIVKLIQVLYDLIKNERIPNNEILFLTCRDDLIDQFKNHVNEFNNNGKYIINLYELKEYDSVHYNHRMKRENEIDVFYYRSDLISDEETEKFIDFHKYENGGKWYIILDEAHKGNKQDSKRQYFYSIMSRNGFLFNFSATFTDKIDYATCVYNFNLKNFIEDGYGKHIYISKNSIKAVGEKNETLEKQKIIIKILTLQSALNKIYDEVKEVNNNMYSKPLLLTLVDSVNIEDSDLELFIKELEKVAEKGIDDDIFRDAKNELKSEFANNAKYEFENDFVDNVIIKYIDSITYNDILKYVFNACDPSGFEVVKFKDNNKELGFKLKTSEKVFGLIKIGDTENWIRDKLSHVLITEDLFVESMFESVNESEDVNILMGSRAFYEGWDSSRPNMILYVNIGTNADSKKFVLQSIGRGVRIEPIKNKRKRLQNLFNNGEVDDSIYSKIKDKVQNLETLFIFGTKAECLSQVIETMKAEKQDTDVYRYLEKNKYLYSGNLIVPHFEDSNTFTFEEKDIDRFYINDEDLKVVEEYLFALPDSVLICYHDNFDTKFVFTIKNITLDEGNRDKYFVLKIDHEKIGDPQKIFDMILEHFNSKVKVLSGFKPLDNEIKHFKYISVKNEFFDSLRDAIERIKKDNKEVIDTLFNLKYIPNHLYNPIIIDRSNNNVIYHAIKNKSEIDFISDLERNLNLFNDFDEWYFSRINENLDSVYIPYNNPNTNRVEKFKPDFIFWLKKGNDYTIVFVDPKSDNYSLAYKKIDGFIKYFEDKTFKYNDFNVKVKLFLYNSSKGVEEKYKSYWISTIKEMRERI